MVGSRPYLVLVLVPSESTRGRSVSAAGSGWGTISRVGRLLRFNVPALEQRDTGKRHGAQPPGMKRNKVQRQHCHR